MTVRPSLQSVLPDTRPQPALVVIAAASGFVMAMLDVTLANASLSALHTQFHASLSALACVVDAYVLTFGALLLFGHAIADRIGARPTYVLGLSCFVLASAASGTAPTIAFLIGSRLVQGVGAALLVPGSLGMLAEALPEKTLRTRMLVVWATIGAVAAGASPLIGGMLESAGGWRSIYYVNVPLGVIGLMLTCACLPLSIRKPWRTDASGPFRFPRRLLCSHTFWSNILVGLTVNAVIFGNLYLLSLYLQDTSDSGPLRHGVQLLPVMAGMSLMSFASGHLSVASGRFPILWRGLAAAIVSCLAAASLESGTAFWQIVLCVSCCNAGLGVVVPTMISEAEHEIEPAEARSVSAALNATRPLGAFAGVVAITAVLRSTSEWATRLHEGFLLFAACLIVALIAACMFRYQNRR